MTNAKELLQAATPLPWKVKRGHPADPFAPEGYALVQIGKDTSYTTGDLLPGDAALIVYAVNHLPDYEAAVDALAALVAKWDEWGYYVEKDDYDMARAALARLRGAE